MNNKGIKKTRTGIKGFDDITLGGLPEGRTSLVCGGPGCGKTLFASEFIVKGATMFNEPGVFMTFEEKVEELAENVRSLGFDLMQLQKDKKVRLDYVAIERSEIEETGEYDLDGLFIRLDHAINSIGAKRVVLDTVENLFSGLTNEGILRAELRRLFQWLKNKNVTAVITAEKGEGALTRHGLEEYVSDCVVLLDHRVIDQISTRRLRVIKYRGSVHGTNEYPFLIDEDGLSVLPVTSIRLDKKASTERISSGIKELDEMLGNKGFYRGSSILVSGTSGTGKTSIAALFAKATCARKERCLFFAFEESPSQIIRNMRSIGVDLEKYEKRKLLRFHSYQPTEYGLEMHLINITKHIEQFKPSVVILDPITNMLSVGAPREVKFMLMRLIDFFQLKGITVMFTALRIEGRSDETTDEGISSLVDAWIFLRDLELAGERNKALFVMKARGMRNSNQIREFIISDNGVELVDIFLGENGVLIGSARRQAQQLQKHGKRTAEEARYRETARIRQSGDWNELHRKK
jgi:circadian clock protein KaiC